MNIELTKNDGLALKTNLSALSRHVTLDFMRKDL